jgi:hypothetical protein
MGMAITHHFQINQERLRMMGMGEKEEGRV